ncbi:MAG: energy-coupling factor transporter transmembrane protein EcfT [Desulfopila sp.]
MQPQSTTTTLFTDKDSWIHRLHPFTKLCYVLFTGVTVYAGPPWWAYKGLLLLLNVALVVSAEVLKKALRVFWRVFLPLLLFMVPIHGFLYPDNQSVALHLYGLNVYQEGLLFAFKTLLHLAVILLASLLFVFTTHPADLITAISHSGKSPTLAYLLGSPLLIMSAVQERIATIQSAQRARGLDTEGNVIRRFCSLAPMIIPLVVGAIVEIEQRSIALEVRGFKAPGHKTSLRIIADSKFQRLGRWLMVMIPACIVVIRFLG